jgi:hypothetical protein
MAPILTAEDVVRRIAAECAYVDERGGVGNRLEPAAAIVRRYGEQFPGAAATAPASAGETASPPNPLNRLAQAKTSKVLSSVPNGRSGVDCVEKLGGGRLRGLSSDPR